MQALHKIVKPGDVKTKTTKSERGSIFTVTKHKICISVIRMLANVIAVQIFQVNCNGS